MKEPEDFLPDMEDPTPNSAPGSPAVESDSVPFDDPAEAAARIASTPCMIAGLMTDEEIQHERYRQIEPGRHTVQVLRVDQQGDARYSRCFLKRADGSVVPTSYVSTNVKVTLCIPGDEKQTTSFFLELFPDTREEQEAFLYGFADEERAKASKNPRKDGGWNAKKLIHWISKLGFKQDSKGAFPAEAFAPVNWVFYPHTRIRRLISAQVEAPYKAPKPRNVNGQVVPGRSFNSVNAFGFQEVPPPPQAAVAHYDAPAASPPASKDQPAAAPAAEPAAKNSKKRTPVAV